MTTHKARPLCDPHPLTPRMVVVLDLLCAGLTNKEIAARLYLAEPTIHDILRQCYQRLGVEKRVPAAVAWTQRRAEYMAAAEAMHAYECGRARRLLDILAGASSNG